MKEGENERVGVIIKSGPIMSPKKRIFTRYECKGA